MYKLSFVNVHEVLLWNIDIIELMYTLYMRCTCVLFVCVSLSDLFSEIHVKRFYLL